MFFINPSDTPKSDGFPSNPTDFTEFFFAERALIEIVRETAIAVKKEGAYSANEKRFRFFRRWSYIKFLIKKGQGKTSMIIVAFSLYA